MAVTGEHPQGPWPHRLLLCRRKQKASALSPSSTREAKDTRVGIGFYSFSVPLVSLLLPFHSRV